MGVQPRVTLTLPTVQEQVTKPRQGSPVGKHASRWHRHHVEQPEVELPEEAQQLKEKILRSNKAKLTRFSLSHMKKRVVPPVEIPREMNSLRALSTTVAGRSVPLTRCMWNNTKRKTNHMEQIAEKYPLHCTLFR